MSDGLAMFKGPSRPVVRDDSTSRDEWSVDLVPVWVGNPDPEEASVSATSRASFAIKEVRVRDKHVGQAQFGNHQNEITEITFVTLAPNDVSSGANPFAEHLLAQAANLEIAQYLSGSLPMNAVVGVEGIGSYLANTYSPYLTSGGGYLTIYDYALPGATWTKVARNRFLSHVEIDGGHRSRLRVLEDQASGRDDTDGVADAATKYLEAFRKVLGTTPQATTSVAEIEGESIWRLTLSVPSRYLEEIEQLIELESKAHSIVRENSPQIAGFFSIQYVASDGHAAADL